LASKEKLIAAAQKFLAKGQLPKAISEYQKLVKFFPKDVRNRQKLAELLSRANRTEDALSEYEYVANNYSETGFYLKAIAVYKQMQKIDPSRVDFYSKLAELNEKQGLVGNALSEYRNLIAFYEQNELVEETVSILEKMLELDPDNLNVRAKITESLYASNRNEEAFDHLQNLIADLDKKQEFSKIIKLYERLQQYCSDDVEARLPLAKALLANGQAEKAVQLLKKLLKDSPESPQILGVLADGYTSVGDTDNARLTYKHILKFAPEDLDIREKLVRACLVGGDAERALEDLETWKDDFFQAERLPVLKELYELIQTDLPDESRVVATLSSIYELTGEKEKIALPPREDETLADDIEQTVSSVLVDEAMADVESLDLVGEEVEPHGEVPPSDSDLKGRSAAPSRGADLELELDLDLDLEQGPVQVASESKNEDEPESISTEETCETTTVDETVQEALSEDVEVELDLDLEGLEDLDLAGLDEAEAHPEDSAEEDKAESVAEEEFATDDFIFDEIGDEEADSTISEELEDEGIADAGEFEVLEELEEVDELEELEELEEVDELEELEELEEVDELEEIEELDEFEDFGEAEQPVGFGEDAAPTVVHARESVKDAEETALANLHTELEDVEFYLQQGLLDDAERVVLAMVDSHGELPELVGMLARIQKERHVTSDEDEAVDFSDIISELNDDELLGAADFLGDDSLSPTLGDELTQELATELDSEDTESHYNLGIAYKEMGLYDDAIAEFDKAFKDPVRQLDCLTLKGQCALEMGEFELAESTLKQGLGIDDLSEEGRVPLHYELGLFYQAAGRPLEALESFQLVADHDLFFRDVGEMVKSLRKELSLDDEQDDGGAQGSRDRISYV
jgi:tetratricopeptide (TPR) repeat protein